MGYEVGVACASCDAYGPLNARFCAGCGALVRLALVAEAHPTGRAELPAQPEGPPPSATRSPVSGPLGVGSPGPAKGAQPAARARDSKADLSAQLSKEELMDQARHYVCKECS